MKTGFSLAIVVKKKGPIGYAVASVRYFLEQLGHSHLVLRGDGENALQSLLRASKEAVAATIQVDIQATPPGSHESIGGAEKFHDTLASQVRTLIHRVESKSGVVIYSYDVPLGNSTREFPFVAVSSTCLRYYSV